MCHVILTQGVPLKSQTSARLLVFVVLTCMVAALSALAAPAEAQPPGSGTTWLCSPSMTSDPCDLPTDTTDLLTGKRTVTPVPPENRKPVDCFYVYPTVTSDPALNAPMVASPVVKSIAEYQAARFRSQCRIFAPVYRQVTLGALATQALGSRAGDLAYEDVLHAWRDYLANDNHGRGVILIGHSQGTLMLRKLIRENIDNNPTVRNRLVGAFLMGGNVSTAPGRTTGGDFHHIPLCTRRGESGCVVAYSTAVTDPPTGLSLFGNGNLDILSAAFGLPAGSGSEIACTDPAVLSGDRQPVGITVPSDPYAFGVISVLMDYTTFPEGLPRSRSSWTTSKERAVGRCVDTNGHHLYRFAVIDGGRQPNELPLFNTHLVDINLGYDRLISIAAQQITSWSREH